jgi:L-lactate dehydrogenase complex protein LldF
MMGVERLVPTMKDLALVLDLLPRSATGQKITVYSSMIRGPKKPEDADGPEERHLILLDNGRTTIAKSPLQESLLCVRCGACINSCPVFREIGGHTYVGVDGESSIYPGPIGSVLTPSLFGYENFGHLVRVCSLCGACKEACPVVTDFPHLILKLRSGVTVDGQKPPNAPWYLKLGMGIFTWIATKPWMFTTAQHVAGFFSRVISPRSEFLKFPKITGWGLAKDFPRPDQKLFRDRFKARQPQNGSVKLTRTESLEAPVENATPQSPAHAEDALERISQELLSLGGNFTGCTTAELAGRIINVLEANNVKAIQAWDQTFLPAGLLERIEASGIQVVQKEDPSIKAGLTGALGIITASGTLILPGGPGKPLLASLLPGIHIAVVQASRIFPNLEEAFLEPEIYKASASALVTGPSRTADIEMTMTIGMHGPGQLHVFCLTDS